MQMFWKIEASQPAANKKHILNIYFVFFAVLHNRAEACDLQSWFRDYGQAIIPSCAFPQIM